MKHSRGLILILSLFFLMVPAALAGGWAVVTLDELPAQVVAGQPLEIGFMARQHGQQPYSGHTITVHAAHPESEQKISVPAKAKGVEGHYVATLNFPQVGLWQWGIETGFGPAYQQPMPPLTVLDPIEVNTPKSDTSPSRAPTLLWGLGLAGGLGAVGSLLFWRRNRTTLALLGAIALAVLSVASLGAAVSGSSTFATAASSEASQQTASSAELGRDLFVAKGCVVCHHHDELSEVRREFAQFRIGPDLPSLINDPQVLQAWLKEPAALKPGTQMPNLELKKDEIDALVAFLISPEKDAAEASAKPSLPAAEAAAKPAPNPVDLFFIRAEGAKGPLVAYDMANAVEHFRLPPGMPSADGQHYVVALPQLKSTLLQIFDPQTSRLERRFTLPGQWALRGVSPTGRWLALTRLPAQTAQTEIEIFDATSGQVAHRLKLEGNFEVETISAAGDALFLIEHLPAEKPSQYQIRLFDLSAEQLQPEALRSKTAADELMTGLAWGGVASMDGRWLLTLYLNTARDVAFVHALDLVEKFPVCIDLPSGGGNFDQLKYYALTFAPDGRTVYAANAALGVVAEVSLAEFQVTRQVKFTPTAFPKIAPAEPAPTNYTVLSQDGQMLYFSGGWDVWGYNTQTQALHGPYLSDTPVRGLGLSADGQRLFVATDKQPLSLDLTGSKM